MLRGLRTIVLLLAFAGCALPGSSTVPARPVPTAPALEPATAVGPIPAPWPAYHRDASRSGVLPDGGVLRNASPTVQRYPAVDGDVYASPLLAGGLVIVATGNDTVYAFDPATRRARWSKHLGTPVRASSLPCGDIAPVTGITSTPVIDPATGTLFVVAFQQPDRHVLYALDLESGARRGSVAVDPPGDSPDVEQQRGALALANGHVYVPFGGLFGDCGQYHGWLVSVPVAGGALTTYQVPCSRECAVWAPAGPVVDASGDLWIATGNGEPFDRYTYANSVLKLSPGLRVLDSFAPADWSRLSQQDLDLGSISPVLLGDGLVYISGKDGRGYLLHADHLGGIGGQAFAGPACGSYSSGLWARPLVYITCFGQLLALRVDSARPSFATAWSANLQGPGAPIVAYGALWVVDTASGRLEALDPTTGRPLFPSISGGSAAHFVTLAAGGGYVYAVLGRRLLAAAATA